MAVPFVTAIFDAPRKLRLTMGRIVQFEQISCRKLREVHKDIAARIMADNLSDADIQQQMRTSAAIIQLLYVMFEEVDIVECGRLLSEHPENIVTVISAIHAAFDTKADDEQEDPDEDDEPGEPKALEFFTFEDEFGIGVGDLGLKPAEFWDLTPAEFRVMHKGYLKARTRRINEMIYQAWRTADLIKAAELPELQSLLLEETPRRKAKQTVEDQVMRLSALAIALGGEVIVN